MGSWLAGAYGKAANLFEKEVRTYVARLLQSCGLMYPDDVVGALKVLPPFEKATLGQLVGTIRQVVKQQPACATRNMPAGFTVVSDRHPRKDGSRRTQVP